MVNLYHFVGLIFVDTHTHTHYVVLYDQAYFTRLIFMVRQSSTKLDPLKMSRYTDIRIQEEIFPDNSY